MELIKSYFNMYKTAILSIMVVLLLGFVVYSYKYTYDKGYNSGFNVATKELDQAYQKALENKLKTQEETLQKNFNILLDAEKQKKKVNTVYVDRIKTVKEIVKADNFKCEMTDEQKEQLNKLTRGIK